MIQKIYLCVVIGLLAISCNPTKNLGSNEVFLRGNTIDISGKIIEQDVLYPYIKQRDNKRAMWFFKVKLQQHLMFNDSALVVKNDKKRKKLTAKNQKRLEAGKDTVEFKPTFFTRLKQSGEKPVIFDSTLAFETATQFEKALFNRGYFHSKITPHFQYNKKRNKVSVIYTADEGPQFKLNKIAIVINDTSLKESVKTTNKYSLLHKGDPFNTDKIDHERLRFTSEMRNQGYYYFTKEYLVYEIDSSIEGNLVDIKIILKNPSEINTASDSVTITQHEKYRIGSITLNTSFNPKFNDNPSDSIHFENLIYVNLSRLEYDPHTFVNKLFYNSGEYYSQGAESKTYTRLSGLNNFKYINIGFSKDDQDTNLLNCNILMTPFPSQSVGVEVEGTNTSGNLGVSGYLSYLHRNIFNNAEQLKIRIKGGLEAQQTNSVSDQSNPDGFNIFNTVEYGIESSLTFQDLLLPSGLNEKILRKFNQPKTSFNYIMNYQNRPDFERFLINSSMAYIFTNKGVHTNQFYIYPIDLSFIRIKKSADFAKRLDELNNPLLDATYDNQFIAGSRIIETWTNKKTTSQNSFALNRAQFELAGNVLYLADKALNNSPTIDTASGDTYYSIGGVRYAQFVKVQNDFHYNTRVGRSQTMAYRFLGGIGVPYGNAKSLPYDRSFYGGGANDMRGWQARSLGPGSMIDSLKVGVDQVADIKLQLSAEYRFNIFKTLEGAIFADAGNIWLLREDPARPNADFDIKRFYEEIALSVGTGARFNFGFLLIRLDWGIKIFDPSLPKGQRFVLNNGDYLNNYKEYTGGKSYQYSVFNLGIGYPF
jgi:outer membrane protein assembly factor BamA